MIYSGKKTCIIVCGHYGCGGVKAAMETDDHGLIDNWLHHIRDVYRAHSTEINAIEGEALKFDKMCELNVIEQVTNVCNTTVVRNAWKDGQELSVHGWIYSIENGILHDLGVCVTGIGEIPAVNK